MKITTREREGWMKFNTYGMGALLCFLFFTNWKSGRRAIRIQIYILVTLGRISA